MSELSYKELQEHGVFDVPYRALEFMHPQQTEIDELKKLRSLDEMEINQLAQANQVWQIKCDELQERVDEAWNELDDRNSKEYIIENLEQILKGNKDGRV